MPNLLTTQAGLKLGPIVLETFFKHYLERKSEIRDEDGSERSTNLRHDELLWQESFEIVKSFLNQATRHTVEELQEFSNARIPAPPWIWVNRVLVPMASCDLAATHLIKALGGEEATKRVVGGTKWWQVRGIRGIDSQWICQKSHMHDARKIKKERNDASNSSSPIQSPATPRFPTFRKFSDTWKNTRSPRPEDTPKSPGMEYSNDPESEGDKELDISDMDGTRCMLYAHGGGYYFGSIDQERYCMQRYARKINGRVFACNYRLSPQYPFPCAIQDMLAACTSCFPPLCLVALYGRNSTIPACSRFSLLLTAKDYSDFYLIDPPSEAMHAPIPPQSIVLGGDSAGGGLCLAVLQVMRDSGVPLPAGAILISPWSDLTHSFPSTMLNTATDIIPPYGLSLHKPSVLWPPPPDEISSKVRAGLRARFQKVGRRAAMMEALFSSEKPHFPSESEGGVQEPDQNASVTTDIPASKSIPWNGSCVEHGDKDVSLQDTATKSPSQRSPDEADEAPTSPVVGKLPLPWESSDSLHLDIDGADVAINTQIQLYCPNRLLVHPLVSPALGYLGGLPPLMVIASEKEVLRDEIVYVAHKAAYPDRFPVNEDAKQIYPPLQNIGDKYSATSVHLQIYDETAHVLPLFSFTTPAKYCYRAIASFTKHVTTPPRPKLPMVPYALQTITPESENSPFLAAPENIPLPATPNLSASTSDSSQIYLNASAIRSVSSILRSQSSLMTRRTLKRNKSSTALAETPKGPGSLRGDSGDVAGNRFKEEESQPRGPGTAGDLSAYAGLKPGAKFPLGKIMIRERVSTQGVLRPLEPESELAALQLPSDQIGKIKEAAALRYIEGHGIWAKKFAKTAAKIEAQRLKNLELAKGETTRTLKTMAQLQEHLFQEQDLLDSTEGLPKRPRPSSFSIHRYRKVAREEGRHSQRHTWVWAWALDGERPPPSSIVSRRDTVEARTLARVADMGVEQDESKMSGNMLWSVLVNFLTAHPRHKDKKEKEAKEQEEKAKDEKLADRDEVKGQNDGDKGTTTSSRILRRIKSFGGSGKKREPSPAPGIT